MPWVARGMAQKAIPSLRLTSQRWKSRVTDVLTVDGMWQHLLTDVVAHLLLLQCPRA